MKSNKIGASSGTKKTNTGNAKPKLPSRTYKKNESANVTGALSSELGGALKFLGKKVGSFFYEYYELVSGIAGLVKSGGVGLWNVGRKILRSGSSVEVVESSNQPSEANNQTKQKPGEIPSSNYLGTPATVVSLDTAPIKLEKPRLDISKNDLNGLSSIELAKLLIQKAEYHESDKKVFLLLNDIANGLQIRDATRYFSAPHAQKKNTEKIENVIASGRKSLYSFIKKRTNNSELAQRIVELLFFEPLIEELPVEVNIAFDYDVVNTSEPLTTEPEVSPPILQMSYPSDISMGDLKQIRAFASVIGVDHKEIDRFLELVLIGENVHSTLSREDVILKIGFLKALSEMKLIDNVQTLPNNLFSLEGEYKHYLMYCRNNEKMKRDVSNLLRASSSYELHSYSTKREIAAFLTAKERISLPMDAVSEFEALFEKKKTDFSSDENRETDAMTKAKGFIKDLARLDASGVEGTLKLFQKAVEKEKVDGKYVFGYYNKAESAVSLLRHFERLKELKGGDLKVVISPESTSKEDLFVEMSDSVYLIKIKSNFERAVNSYDIEQMKAFVKNAKAKQAFEVFDTSSGSPKAVFPVCVVKNAGNTLIDLENRVINEKNKREFVSALKALLSIQKENEKFQLWDINGNDISTPLRERLSFSTSNPFTSTRIA